MVHREGVSHLELYRRAKVRDAILSRTDRSRCSCFCSSSPSLLMRVCNVGRRGRGLESACRASCPEASCFAFHPIGTSAAVLQGRLLCSDEALVTGYRDARRAAIRTSEPKRISAPFLNAKDHAHEPVPPSSLRNGGGGPKSQSAPWRSALVGALSSLAPHSCLTMMWRRGRRY
jgi:hypothetical protein